MNTLDVITFPCFTIKQVKEINEEIRRNKQTYVKEESYKAAKNATKTGEFFRVPCHQMMKLVHPWMGQNQIISKKVFGYEIYWDLHIETFNYNEYGINGEYEWHVDAGIDDSPHLDTKLTCLLNLSEEPYEGGEFHTIHSDKEHEFTSGMGIVFNSLLAHKVTPLTKGKRITLTYWAMGPTWR